MTLDTWTFAVVIALCGAGTFLLRWLPMRWLSRGLAAPHWRRLLASTGPAAIAALLTASLAGILPSGAEWMHTAAWLPTVAGLAGVCLGYRWPGGIGWATLAGAACHALAGALLA